MPDFIRTALVDIYNAGGGRTRRLPQHTVDALYNNGYLAHHRNICSLWATYQLTPDGLNVADSIA